MKTDKEFYDSQGYLVFKPDLEPNLLDTIVKKLDGQYSQKATGYGSDDSSASRIQDAWKVCPEVKELALNQSILSKLKELYDSEPLPFQTLNFPIGTEQATHSDTIHFSSDPPGNMCGVWVALEDATVTNGPLRYYPGSHKLKAYNMQDFGLRSDEKDYPKYEAKIQELVDTNKLEAQYGTIKKGECIVWSANLLHGGSKILDPKATRYSQVTHYFFKSDYFYTPLFSTPGELYLRNPDWIK